MKSIDVFYLESENISCISIQRTDIEAGRKIVDKTAQYLKWIVLLLMAAPYLEALLDY